MKNYVLAKSDVLEWLNTDYKINVFSMFKKGNQNMTKE